MISHIAAIVAAAASAAGASAKNNLPPEDPPLHVHPESWWDRNCMVVLTIIEAIVFTSPFIAMAILAMKMVSLHLANVPVEAVQP